MWIRSQDKTVLAKINNIFLEKSKSMILTEEDLEEIKDSYRIIAYIKNNKYFDLGTYKSKERAIEVLDEVEKKINLINLGHDFGSPMIDLKNPTYIYQMPEE